ncbi:rap1 GTPase-GDP dissociation stimulator 1-B isoform X1 [Neodiprion fabricii]|uniref:rap1 GTPase-GDP dissociation stimulator 1-B isoform X1 n=1 Tax=Neodiprion fabricii TaxID=2872261 RepID=UPI001ED9199E|nr:rap1 GTPase-GDP dissociation stimulator 1-B isoform X1 [Neodiprion fabricii]XP_046412770.1 rap1 GTPase-GDP dissociation stimulator 1-B isoform X1 [Neodiprion fabricii]
MAHEFVKCEVKGETTHNIDKLFGELLDAIKSGNEIKENGITNIMKILDSLINVSKTSVGETLEFAIDDVFLTLLKYESPLIVAKTTRAIAEIAKTDRGREKCTNPELIKALVELLKGEYDIDILTQASRALGNICYENDKGKMLVDEQNGLTYILTALKMGISLGDGDGAAGLRNVAAGFLLNFLINQTALQKKALDDNVLSVVCSILETDGTTSGEAATHAMLILGILTDLGQEVLDERLTKILVNILASDASPELSEMCLELLHGQAENESTKLLLAKAGVCELLLKLLEKHGPRCTDEEARSVLKVACDLIVLILTGDDSMDVLYNGSNGEVYKKLVDWLESDDEDLQLAAVLAMGNFARSDTHCELMVTQGVHRKLLRLLSKNDNRNCPIRLQHALLSALRNLVIPSCNKALVLADGLVDVVYPMLDIPTFPVVFKLLGTLRMVIDGQQEAAISLGKREDLIKRTVEWCGTEDHPGVQGEANRLLAWLIKNSRDKEVASLIISHGAIKHLVKMLTAQHALMQNEALLSLTILTTISLVESQTPVIEAEIGSTIRDFLDKHGPQIESPIIYNTVALTDSLVKSDVIKEHLVKSALPAAWKKLLKIRAANIPDLMEKVMPLCLLMGAEID